MADRLFEALPRVGREPGLDIGEARLAEDIADAREAEADGRGEFLGIVAEGRAREAGAQGTEDVADGVQLLQAGAGAAAAGGSVAAPFGINIKVMRNSWPMAS